MRARQPRLEPMVRHLGRLVRSPRQRSSTAVVLAGVTIALIVSLTGASSTGPDDAAIRQTCRGALLADLTLTLPDPAQQGQSYSDTTSRALQDRVPQELATYYTGALLANKTAALQRSIQTIHDEHTIPMGGGITKLDFSTVSVHGASATATAQARIWSKTNADPTPNGVENTVSITFKLTKSSAGWRITGEQLTFAEGTGP